MKLFISQDKTPSRPAEKAFPFGESGTRHRKRFPLRGEWHEVSKTLSPSGRVTHGTENAFPFGESGTQRRKRFPLWGEWHEVPREENHARAGKGGSSFLKISDFIG